MSARCGELFDVTRSIVVFAAAASLTIAAGAGVSFAQSEPGAGAAGATTELPPGAASEAQAMPYFPFLSHYCEKSHNTEGGAGSIAFGVMSPKDIRDDEKTW